MKKVVVITLILAILLMIPAYAGDAAPSTDLRYQSLIAVYAIDATYTVKTEEISDLTVTFAEGIGNTDYNLVGQTLYISIASASPLDLSGVIAQVTASLTGGSQAAPELELTALRFNGKKASVSGIGSAKVSGQDLAVSLPVSIAYAPASYTLVLAAYTSDGRLAGATMLSPDRNATTTTISATLSGCASADKVKAYFLGQGCSPIAIAADIPIQ